MIRNSNLRDDLKKYLKHTFLYNFMPRQPINYDNTCFYKIVCKNVDIHDIYVGHTTDFTTRKTRHKNICMNPNFKGHNSRVYSFIRDNGGWDNFDMILIERTKCEDILDAKRKERKYIEDMQATLNSNLPNRTQKEWTADNIDKITEYKHNWHVENKEHVSQNHKTDYINQRERIIEKAKKYYEENTDKCKEWKSGIVKCECGLTYTNSNKARHFKSKSHLENLTKTQI